MNKEWVEWKGGTCPVPKGVLVDVKLRNGAEFDNQFAQANDGSSWASSGFWRHDVVPYDIIAWRLHQNTPATDRKRDEFTDACIGLDSSQDWSHSTDYFRGLYNAIASGKIPGVKLENEND